MHKAMEVWYICFLCLKVINFYSDLEESLKDSCSYKVLLLFSSFI